MNLFAALALFGDNKADAVKPPLAPLDIVWIVVAAVAALVFLIFLFVFFSFIRLWIQALRT